MQQILCILWTLCHDVSLSKCQKLDSLYQHPSNQNLWRSRITNYKLTLRNLCTFYIRKNSCIEKIFKLKIRLLSRIFNLNIFSIHEFLRILKRTQISKCKFIITFQFNCVNSNNVVYGAFNFVIALAMYFGKLNCSICKIIKQFVVLYQHIQLHVVYYELACCLVRLFLLKMFQPMISLSSSASQRQYHHHHLRLLSPANAAAVMSSVSCVCVCVFVCLSPFVSVLLIL